MVFVGIGNAGLDFHIEGKERCLLRDVSGRMWVLKITAPQPDIKRSYANTRCLVMIGCSWQPEQLILDEIAMISQLISFRSSMYNSASLTPVFTLRSILFRNGFILSIPSTTVLPSQSFPVSGIIRCHYGVRDAL